jgi:hypothetical protein
MSDPPACPAFGDDENEDDNRESTHILNLTPASVGIMVLSARQDRAD